MTHDSGWTDDLWKTVPLMTAIQVLHGQNDEAVVELTLTLVSIKLIFHNYKERGMFSVLI